MPTIVVVEDDASMAQAIERILCAGGYCPVLFASAEDALADKATKYAGCLLLDIYLSGMSGLEMYQQLAREGAVIPAIFITAHDEPGLRAEAERLGARAYLLKPFSGRALLDVVGQVLCSG